jgi:hypothetical protein
MDADTYAVVGDIPDTQGVHGIAIATELGRGFTSNGRSDNVTWDLNASLSTNDNKVLSLFPGTSFVTQATYSNAPSVRHQVGFPAYSFFGPRVVAATVDATGTAVKSSEMCDDGKGGVTPCYSGAGSLIAPSVYLGHSVPTYEGSFSTTVSFLRDFRIYTQIDYSGGNKKIDGNTRVRCFFFGGRCQENFFPTQADPIPENLNWDLWLGPAADRPYYKDCHPFKWRGFWDFGTGAFGDMGCHIMNWPFTALELGQPISAECVSEEGATKDSPPKRSGMLYASVSSRHFVNPALSTSMLVN